MKTILIAISTGIIARNILRTDVFKMLKQRQDVRLVLLLPPKIDDYLKEELEGENVVLESQKLTLRAGLFRHFLLYPLMQNLVYTATSKMMFRYGSRLTEPRDTPVRYFLSRIFFGFLSKFVFLKRLCRWLDHTFFSRYDRSCVSLFDKYQPSLLVVNNILHDPVECALIRVAKRWGIPSVGMVKSWDNLEKWLLTVLPDTFLVWDKKMFQDLVKLQDVQPEKIILTGVPQFDIYQAQSILLSREEYCRELGLDPKKKILLFASQWSFAYDDEVADIIHQFIQEGAFKKDCLLLVRPHFKELELKTGRFERFRRYPFARLDKSERTGECFGGWDPSLEDMKHLANNLYHCALLLTSCSTIAIDAAVFDKPVITIGFDGAKERSKPFSYKRAYKYNHCQAILRTEGTKFVENKEDLKTAINQYLENPSLNKEGRERLRQVFCYKLDGRSGQRIAQAILARLYAKGTK